MQNPLVKFKEKHNLTYTEMANYFDVSSSTIYKNLTGANHEITPEIIIQLEELGYNIAKVRQQYNEFRKTKRANMLK